MDLYADLPAASRDADGSSDWNSSAIQSAKEGSEGGYAGTSSSASSVSVLYVAPHKESDFVYCDFHGEDLVKISIALLKQHSILRMSFTIELITHYHE